MRQLALMGRDLEDLLLEIDGTRGRHLALMQEILKADSGNLFPLDLLASAVINRSLSNCDAFTGLIRAKNYLAAATLVRLQLDSCLRFYASFLVQDPHEFATSVLAGTKIRKIKDRSGSPMTDRYLVESISAEYPWAPNVYEQASGFIHLSDKHIYSTIRKAHDDGRLDIYVGVDPGRFPEHLWIELADAFIAATEAQFCYLEGWGFTKSNPELVASVRESSDEC